MKIPQTMEEQKLLVNLAYFRFGFLSRGVVDTLLAEYDLVKEVGGEHYPQMFLAEKYANQSIADDEAKLGLPTASQSSPTSHQRTPAHEPTQLNPNLERSREGGATLSSHAPRRTVAPTAG